MISITRWSGCGNRRLPSMPKPVRRAGCMALLGLILGFALAPTDARAQGGSVSAGSSRVVSDGEVVRLQAAGASATVQGDWRAAAGTGVTVTGDALLVELGAVRSRDHVRVSVAGDVLFASGSAAIDAQAAATLAKIAQLIREQARGEVLVVGHTDSIGSADANQDLSQQRALAVIDWLVREQHIPATLLVARGMGESRPLVRESGGGDMADQSARARNRRVELFIGTTPTANVRVAAGLVQVNTDAGTVHIGDDRIDSDQVHIAPGRVSAGGVTVDAGGSASDKGGGVDRVEPASDGNCAAGRTCTMTCFEGDCDLTCPAGARCDFSCEGGGCTLACAAGAHCNFACPGGDCRFACALGSTCNTSCTGEGCSGS